MKCRYGMKIIWVCGIITTICMFVRKAWNEYLRILENYIKFRSLFQISNMWLSIKEQGRSLETYFAENNYRTIAVYGLGTLGKHLLEELENSDIVKVVYGIDRAAESIMCPIDILTGKGDLPEVDAVIVTTVLQFEDIKKQLREKVQCPVISLEEIIKEIKEK